MLGLMVWDGRAVLWETGRGRALAMPDRVGWVRIGDNWFTTCLYKPWAGKISVNGIYTTAVRWPYIPGLKE